MGDLLFNPDVAIVFCGSLSLVTLWLAWNADKHVLGKMALWLVTSCAISNALYTLLGHVRQPWIDPAFTALIALFVGRLSYRSRSIVGWLITGLFALQSFVVVTFFSAQTAGSILYFVTLNAIFVVQIFIVGRSSVERLHHRLCRRDPLFHSERFSVGAGFSGR